MAFAEKQDYCGLKTATSNTFDMRTDDVGGTVEKYQPLGGDGDFIGTEVFGEDSSPRNTYGLKTDLTATAGMIKLGTITTVGQKKFALESITIGTSAGGVVTIDAQAQEVESTATDATIDHYSVPAFALKRKQIAQTLFSAFQLTGAGCSLTSCSATIGCTVGKDDIAGVKISSDINSGVITVSGNVIQAGATAPTITAEEGWTITKPIAGSASNPEKAYKTYSFELQKKLTKDVVSP